MLVKHVLNFTPKNNIQTTIQRYCSQFIEEANRQPLYKWLPNTYNDLHKVKVRQQKKQDAVTHVFNKAFEQEHVNIRQRAIFTYSHIPENTDPSQDLFFVFPTDGYKYMFCTEVQNSTTEYRHMISTLLETMSDNNQRVFDIVSDLLKFTYTKTNLLEGILKGTEIIFYGIPSFYVVRCNSVDNYQSILE